MRYRIKSLHLIVIAAILLLLAAAAIALSIHKSRPLALNESKIQTTANQPELTVPTEPQSTMKVENANKPMNEVTPPDESYDVVIIGSELEGLYLARAAADEGLRVKILDPKNAFGGQVLQGQMLFLDETRDEHGKLLVQGRAKELFDGFRNAKIRKLPEFEAYMKKLLGSIPIEEGIQIQDMQNHDAEDQLHHITSITYVDQQQTKKTIGASYWVDNTDNAALLSRLEVTRLPGLEAFYGQNNIEYMSSGMMMKFTHVDWKTFNTTFNKLKQSEKNKRFGGGYVSDSYAIGLSGVTSSYHPSNDRVFLRGLNAVNQRDGDVLINALLVYTVDPASSKSVQEAVYLGNNETKLIVDHFRQTLPGWEHAEVGDLPTYPYIREYNHYEMDYTLKPSDLLSGKMFWDNVSIGGYPLDLQGTSANKWGIEMGRPDKYGMPLRSFLLKNYDNVIAAGKNVGSSAIAFGSTRIQPNTSLAAESIGVMLGQLQGKERLMDINAEQMDKLHQYLEKKYHIKLTGVTADNKLKGWTEQELSKLDTGEITYPSYSQVKKKQAKSK
ncbi:FAD-dependent oxidoreductase [Paenibacillus hexagrammi]|uniref:FAD-dependent oxidoreductase n=1 Tax=Paenibacillus hexagrammi TaxID=2908839 RepID=A0ABY3SFW6_9BACL|nr:FAD-dependent oxidoreductase [Paenibacillus sp. YPD9-1]UJF32139.1 FAD-dependent oxidoreductase [Paenibacillus sp. YPD9-1]